MTPEQLADVSITIPPEGAGGVHADLLLDEIKAQVPEPQPFEKAVFEALSFEANQVRKVDVSIGPRSQSVTFKFALTSDQVKQLDAMANVTPDHA